jgi:predicted RNA-binding protein with EMAP domain
LQDRYKKSIYSWYSNAMIQDFKTAYERLQSIATYLKSDQIIDVDELMKLQEEAKLLHEFLQSKLLNSSHDE